MSVKPIILHDNDVFQCAPGVVLSKKSNATVSCSNERLIGKVIKFLKHHNAVVPSSNAEAVSLVISLLNVEHEAHIYTDERFTDVVGYTSQHELDEVFLPSGPRNSTELLSNFDIDASLTQWERAGKYFKNGPFKALPFEMIDFASKRDSMFNNLDIADLIKNGYRSFGCVINTDVWAGNGIHWFCIYGDLSGKGTEESPYFIEYFNSSGNSPRDQIVTWANEKMTDASLKDIKVKFVRTAHIEIQKSETECGVWSLCYIKSRLVGKPFNFFEKKNITDDQITETRKFLFR